MISKPVNRVIKKEPLSGEVWKKYNNNYQVSNFGNVRSVDRFIIKSNGRFCKRVGMDLSQSIDSGGYRQVSLGRSKPAAKVHRLVAELFIKNTDNKKTVNHKDGVKTNNHVSNLEWATYTENNKHAREMGLCNPKGCPNPKNGIDHWNSKLDEVQIKVIKSFPAGTLTQSQLGAYFNVSRSLISGIRSGSRWKHLNMAA